MSKPRLRNTWLLRRHEALTLLSLYALFTGVWFLIGWSLTHPLKDSSIVHTDQSISEWFVKQRTPGLNSLTYIGSMLADTVVKIVVTAIVAIAMLIVWKRWLEPLMVSVALILEALCFITVTTLVGRPRPDVPRLETSPVGSSFPSGHMAAAVAYSAIAVVVFWHTRRRWIRALAVAVAVILPVCVGLSRMYRGMHFFTDVVFGALLGGACVFATAVVLRHAAERQHQVVFDELPAPTEPTAGRGRRPVSVPLVVLLCGLAAALLAFAISASRRIQIDAVDPTEGAQAVRRSLWHHPRVERFLRERMDRKTAGGFLLTASFVVLFVVAILVGLLLDMIDNNTGLAAADRSVAAWGSRNGNSTTAEAMKWITQLGSSISGHHGPHHRRLCRFRPPPQSRSVRVRSRHRCRRTDPRQRSQAHRQARSPGSSAPGRGQRVLVPLGSHRCRRICMVGDRPGARTRSIRD